MSYYKVDIEKLKYRSDFYALLGCISVPENYEHLDKVKKFLDIPDDSPLLRKTADERFDPLIEGTRLRFSALESRIKQGFDKFGVKQDKAFEFAKAYGNFPRFHVALKGTATIKGLRDYELGYDPASGQLLMSNGGGTEWVALGESGWSRCVDKEPNAFVKWLAKAFLGLKWSRS